MDFIDEAVTKAKEAFDVACKNQRGRNNAKAKV